LLNFQSLAELMESHSPPSYTTLFGAFTFLWPQPKNQCHYIRTYSCSFWIKLLIIFELFFQVSRLCTIEPREFCCYIIGRTFHSFLPDELNKIKNFLQSILRETFDVFENFFF